MVFVEKHAQLLIQVENKSGKELVSTGYDTPETQLRYLAAVKCFVFIVEIALYTTKKQKFLCVKCSKS